MLTEPQIYKCEWCNAKHDEQFLICSVCRKKRKDIWYDETRAISYLVVGLVVAAIGFCVFYFNNDNSQFLLNNGWICVSAIFLGLIILIISAFYNQRARKKLKLNEFE